MNCETCGHRFYCMAKPKDYCRNWASTFSLREQAEQLETLKWKFYKAERV